MVYKKYRQDFKESQMTKLQTEDGEILVCPDCMKLGLKYYGTKNYRKGVLDCKNLFELDNPKEYQGKYGQCMMYYSEEELKDAYNNAYTHSEGD